MTAKTNSIKKQAKQLADSLHAVEDDGFSAMVADLLESGRTDLLQDAAAFLLNPALPPTKALRKAVCELYEAES